MDIRKAVPSARKNLKTSHSRSRPTRFRRGLRYETALKTDQFVLIAHGSATEISQAKDVLARTSPENVDHHAA